MSGWHSLSGYLHYKSNSALGRLIAKKKVWCVLEESTCQLRYFKHEEDSHHQRAAQGQVDINGAAISLDLENQNQFVVLSDGKEHIFKAENHESMMIWLLGLQARREMHCRKLADGGHFNSEETDVLLKQQSKLDLSAFRKPTNFFLNPDQGRSSSTSMEKFSWGNYESHKWSLDSQLCATKRRMPEVITDSQGNVRSRSLPPVFEGLETSKSFPFRKGRSLQRPMGLKRSGSANLYPDSSSCESDDVFRDEMRISRRRSSVHRKLRSTQSLMTSHQVAQSAAAENVGETNDMYSSRSASSDSAIDKGEGSQLELSARLSELEKELISTKCELAKVMNRQACYSDLLQLRENTIKGLENKIDDATVSTKNEKKSSPKPSAKALKTEKEFQEKIRILQNQNRFLNEEVKKLARIRLLEHGTYQEQNQKLQKLEADIEKWKIDYVTLIQSSIRFPGDEGIEDIELNLYGGDKHKKRLQSLLDEARKINPRLPCYESLANNEVHVDSYGFKHVYTNTGLLLHYLCTELTQHYLMQAGVYETHQRQWTMFMRQHGKNPLKAKKQLKILCRKGVPDRFRKQVWRSMVTHTVKDVMEDKGQHYYRNLCNMLPESPLAACYRKQISLDLMRTMPSNVKFSTVGSKGIMDLQDVLLAFCVHNPTVGYCQGMNFIVGMTLLFLDAQEAFWALVAITEKYFSQHYFDHSLIGAQADQLMLKEMVKDKLPRLYHHLEMIDIELSTVTLNWFLAIFFDAVPFQTLLRIWDCFLLDGPKVLFRFSLAILKLHEHDILQKTDTIGVMKHLKACAKLTYDVDGLVKLVFEDLKPFPKRRDIISKQTCYLNVLKEKHMKKELQRLAFAEREQMYMNMEAEAGIFMGIECATALAGDQVWLCYGDQHIGKISCVNVEQGTMCSLDVKLDSRLMCMCTVRQDVLVLGTISWMLIALNVKTREPLWQIQLHDAILSVCCYDDSDTNTLRIFCGLADGTLAVLEPTDSMSEPNLDVLYIPIGQAPVTCLMLLDDQIWCASGNNVAIIHARTLDSMDTFSVSVNPYDHILSLVHGDYGIWISLRGSSILELWDPKTLNCRMLYDTRTDRYPQLRREDDTYFNRARITSILANENLVWVGTGEGNMIIYEVLESAQLKTPIDRSPSTENIPNSFCTSMKPKKQELNTSDLELKVNELYKLRQEKEQESIGNDSGCQDTGAGEHREPDIFCVRGKDSLDDSILQRRGSRSGLEGSNTMRRGSKDFLEGSTSMRRGSKDFLEGSTSMRRGSKDFLEVSTSKRRGSKEFEEGSRLRRGSKGQTQTMLQGTEEENDNEEYQTSKDNIIQELYEETLEEDAQRRQMHNSEMEGVSSQEIEREVKLLYEENMENESSRRSSAAFELQEQVQMFTAQYGRGRRTSLPVLTLTSSNDKVQNYRKRSVSSLDIEECAKELVEQTLEADARRRSYTAAEIQADRNMMHRRTVENDVRRCSMEGLELHAEELVNEFPQRCSLSDCSSLLDCQVTSTDPSICLSLSPNTLSECSSSGVFSPMFYPSSPCPQRRGSKHLLQTEDVVVHGKKIDTGEKLDKNVCTCKRQIVQKSDSVPSNMRGLRQESGDVSTIKDSTGKIDHVLITVKRHGSLEEKMDQTDAIKPSIITCKECSSKTPQLSLNKDSVDSYHINEGERSSKLQADAALYASKLHEISHNADISHNMVKITVTDPGSETQAGRERKLSETSISRRDKVDSWLSSFSGPTPQVSLYNELSVYGRASVGNKSSKQPIPDKRNTSSSESDSDVFVLPATNQKETQREQKGEKPSQKEKHQAFVSTAKSQGYSDVKKNTSQQCPETATTAVGATEGERKPSIASTSSSLAEVTKTDPGVQYRLDFSGLRVETDSDMESTAQESVGESSINSFIQYMKSDSRRSSLDVGAIQEKSHRFDSHFKDRNGSARGSLDTSSQDRQKIFEFLKTPSLASRQMSLGLKIIEDDLEWTDLYSHGQLSTLSPSSSTQKRLEDFMKTPSISSKQSSQWSSYENISTPSQLESSKESNFLKPSFPPGNLLSHSASTVSFGSVNDMVYNVDLGLEMKVKISDKPVKCLLHTWCKNEPIILSFSGSYGDDEAVLKWKKKQCELLWTNEPVLEVCPKTHVPKLPSYMRRRLSSGSSFQSHSSSESPQRLQ